MDWAAELGIGLDFNPTFFAHPKAADGFTLAHRDEGIRRFWVEHGIACRKIGEAMGRRQGTPCVTQRLDPRRHEGRDDRPQGAAEILKKSLDKMFAATNRPRSTATRSRASSSASAPRPTWSARTSFTWAMPWRTRSC